ncbi:MAG: hypothetical protein HYR85_19175 [Planctomycetes bacterium]|nr:hypothetical protein [Planctomycetota bacterium]MBI3845428.1 hypothetical protein [Planctomycetota bacterium]
MKRARALSWCIALVASTSARAGDSKRYVADFEFVSSTVAARGAAVASKKIDWKATCDAFAPRFSKCASDVEHVKLVMELLATLRDSHTGVTHSSVDEKLLPSKWDGLYGGGLWFGWDEGKFVLRGVMKTHPLEKQIPLGSVLVSIDGEPAWLSMERERRRIATYQGISTDHGLFASLGNKLLPFRDKQKIKVTFLLPSKETKEVEVGRWGPGGKAFYPEESFRPEGVATAEGATSAFIEAFGSKKIGYLEVTGGMNEPTVKAFHAAFDRLKGMEALVLDCRGMGGGGDAEAWEMCGRFFPKGVANGRNGRIEASGSWQFDGPVVMLQDELEVSSAETFTWALTETGRVVSIGRTTGGWGIIPNGFECPSGLVSFRLGVNDRGTPVRGVHTEGMGWPPDVLVPFGPVLTGRGDDVREIGMNALRCLRAGIATEEVRGAFATLVDGKLTEFRGFAKRNASKLQGVDAEKMAKLVADDLAGEIAMEAAWLKLEGDGVPNVSSALRRCERLSRRAAGAGLDKEGAALLKAAAAQKPEAAADEALLGALDARFEADAKERKAFLSKYGTSKIGKWLRESLWK